MMDAIELLTTRSSQPRLQDPAPSGAHWTLIQQAALRVPDHGGIQPWSFIVFESLAQRQQLGELFAQALTTTNPDAPVAAVEKAKNAAMRAPLVIACIAKCKDHPKVPRIEQILSAGCAVMAMQQMAFSLGYGGVWRTGDNAHNPAIKPLLGLAPEDEVVGYLYLGTPEGKVVCKPTKKPEKFFVEFQG